VFSSIRIGRSTSCNPASRRVFHNALRAEKLAGAGDGFFTHDWSGSNQEAEAGSLQTHAATLQALAWTTISRFDMRARKSEGSESSASCACPSNRSTASSGSLST